MSDSPSLPGGVFAARAAGLRVSGGQSWLMTDYSDRLLNHSAFFGSDEPEGRDGQSQDPFSRDFSRYDIFIVLSFNLGNTCTQCLDRRGAGQSSKEQRSWFLCWNRTSHTVKLTRFC